MNSHDLKQECLAAGKWLRLLFMIIFAAVTYATIFLIWLIAAFQFLYHLITGKNNQPLLQFSSALSRYMADIMAYLCYNKEQKPFPFAEWPKSIADEEE
jgi:hypothetical protein